MYDQGFRMTINRRGFLRAAGVTLALPWLAAAEPAKGKADGKAEGPPRRLVCICTNLGLMEKNFTPALVGRDYVLTPYLEPLKDLRDRFTVVTGTSHGEVTGGHAAEVSFLTAAAGPGTASFRNTISLDQFAAERIGHLTRHSNLSLVVAANGTQSLSVTRSGVMLPAEASPGKVFRTLFVNGDAKSVEQQVERLRTGRSILDTVGERAAAVQKKLGGEDRGRLDHYLTSVREVERRLLLAEEWEHKPKPMVSEAAPAGVDHLLGKLDAMSALIRLALSTDSTRLITLFIRLDGFTMPGVSDECHGLSHHVGRQDKIDQLAKVEREQMARLAALLTSLKGVNEGGASLLDRTSVLYGSNLGNGNNHDTRNMPIVVAGGAFKHGSHLAFDRNHNTPLSNLFVNLLQGLGIEADRFASSTGTLKGFESA